MVKLTVSGVYNGAGIALMALKFWADFRKHAGHRGHSQKCDCFGGCLPCTAEAIRRDGAAKKIPDE